MTRRANLPRILLIDSNVYFSKRLGDALKQQGFEVVTSTQSAYALTMLEWNTPSAILCATNLREMGALEMAPILRADPKTAIIPLIAIGGGGGDKLCSKHFARAATITSIAAVRHPTSPRTSAVFSSATRMVSDPRRCFRARKQI